MLESVEAAATRLAVLKSLEPLLVEAERSGRWLLNSANAVALSPGELRQENARGRYLWGAVNWRLVDPAEICRSIDRKVSALIEERANIVARIKAEERAKRTREREAEAKSRAD